MKTSSDRPAKGRIKLARSFRKRPSEAEYLMWGYLRNRGMGVKFRRQVPVGQYIVDFLSLEARMVVEIDGKHHGTSKREEKDRKRDNFLQKKGYEVIHFWAHEVVTNLEGSLEYLGKRIRGSG